jgi:hypothetical protein
MSVSPCPEDQKLLLEIATAISRHVSTQLATSRKGNIVHHLKINGHALYMIITKRHPCSEQVFVQALNFVKAKYPWVYKSIELPSKWNGGSRNLMPEIYKEKGKILCQVRQAVTAHCICDECDADRIWQPGEFVWVPRDHQIVIEYLDNGTFDLLDLGE